MGLRVSNIIYTERHNHPGVDAICSIEYIGDVVHKAVDEVSHGVVVPEHVHLYYEFSLITSGTVTYSVDGEDYTLSSGDLCITYPGELHQMTCPTGQEWRMLYIAVSGCRLGGIGAALQQSDLRLLSNCSTFAPDLLRMLREIRERRFGYSEMVSMLAGIWLTELCRLLNTASAGQSAVHQSDAVRLARDHIEYACRHDMSVDEIAMGVGISKSHLSHLFTQEMGVPLCTYARQVLMQRARRMLRDGRLTVTEISDKLGFPTLHCFSAAFKRHQGVSPMAYRRENRTARSGLG